MAERQLPDDHTREIESLIRRLDAELDPTLRPAVQALVRALLEMHADGLRHLLDLAGPAMVDRFAADRVASRLLLLHGLHPVALETRITQALEKTRPILGAHGGSVRLIGIEEDGTAYLQLEGNCHGCPSSRVTLQSAIEEAIYDAAPDVTGLVVQGVTDGGPRPALFTSCPAPADVSPAATHTPS